MDHPDHRKVSDGIHPKQGNKSGMDALSRKPFDRNKEVN
jgi:hypothetical protein